LLKKTAGKGKRGKQELLVSGEKKRRMGENRDHSGVSGVSSELS